MKGSRNIPSLLYVIALCWNANSEGFSNAKIDEAKSWGVVWGEEDVGRFDVMMYHTM